MSSQKDEWKDRQAEWGREKFGAMLWRRFRDLIAKIVSIKMVIFVVACVLLRFRLIDGWTWLITGTIVIGSRTFEKLMDKRM